MAKVVLVYPPAIFGRKEGLGLPPLGILYLASFLKNKNISVAVIDGVIKGYSLEELLKEILRHDPGIVGLSAMTCQSLPVLEIAKELRKRKPALKIIVGGHHINATKGELFQFTNDVDFLFYGEGEKELYNLITSLDNHQPLEAVRGLIFKRDGKIVVNEPPLPIMDLDELPFPDLDLLDINEYDIYYAKSLPMTSLLASRGCPFSCIYCSAAMVQGKKFRRRSPRNVADEIEHNYKKYGIRQFAIKDSTFTADKQWVYDICAEIEERNLKIHWTCNSRANLLDEDLLRVMKKSGCYFIAFGIESGSQKILDILQKGITVQEIRDGLALCKKTGMKRIGTFMIGNPTENETDALETLRMIKSLDLDLAFTFATIAYPGTPIYDWAVANKALLDRFWYMKKSGVAFAGNWETNGTLKLESLSQDRVMKLVKKANKSFYFRPSFVWERIKDLRGLAGIKRNYKSLKKLLWKKK